MDNDGQGRQKLIPVRDGKGDGSVMYHPRMGMGQTDGLEGKALLRGVGYVQRLTSITPDRDLRAIVQILRRPACTPTLQLDVPQLLFDTRTVNCRLCSLAVTRPASGSVLDLLKSCCHTTRWTYPQGTFPSLKLDPLGTSFCCQGCPPNNQSLGGHHVLSAVACQASVNCPRCLRSPTWEYRWVPGDTSRYNRSLNSKHPTTS